MADYDTKGIPSQLRGQSSVAQAHTHRDTLSKIAKPSSSRSDFRSHPTNEVAAGDKDFQEFSSQRASNPNIQPWQQSSEISDSDAARIAATTWAADDLRAINEDGAAVLEMLEHSREDSLDDELRALSDSQNQSWRLSAENAIPPRTVRSTLITSGYLDAALNSTADGASLIEYLRMHSYTDDVWGLPSSLIEDLDTLKDSTESQHAQDKAIGRLQMLKRHMLRTDSDDATPTRMFTADAWDSIWNAG